ncbi:bifunctional methylenetetrahydrofolate dehydrogenase/methenyltetrahydrofolate cyclohydrolase [Clostridium sp. CMCC3677]|uniref:bifunctional methylenetetrahydrofolate dehydrogenase/methenyltetrahydrofolate cyclohydrolase n=1 Tax=Clostridium sp. CMCC3677 TaxID=2949963 RepID=UPI0013F1364A|nr:bifunctional methylenetetrahydrofolate dehydrogenase/methenyltetrahydrofolate cyclohydrolase [Clostridium sp. CMCC3677]NFG62176.1 bifunctional methylenetetrahydrofolate dehydrogenase/methenyltetrahydrofolate cyclohydrolase [Clostridium botulinum]NFQ09584.1 bifunctional methylenetetrahydrofolate dehydrogenase/methenyltetrahydrofolate cyclohydrolase [Clostridium botulinum]
MGQIINGKEVALKIKEEIKTFVEERKNNKLRIPKIASILVGNDGGSIYYMSSQEKVANSLGIDFLKIILEEDVTDEDVINEIHKLNEDVNIQGIMLQLPLPKHLNEKKIIKEISVKKDIDCLTFESQGKLYMGEKGFLPCTPNSVVTLIKSLNIDITGKEVVVLGRSNIVGKPVAQLLLNENATVTICHSKTKNLKEVCSKADILVVAIGKPKFIDEEYIKENAIVIDVGTSSFEGKITGDVNFDKVIDKASFVTPVPGGVGALTTTLLIKNSCEALKEYED